ncbi:hypothetical protein [Chelativorans xinjiangense]|uniref:hypothetical protein n=1 Tax=Chelativorans xinjiangense TaxID=2681485 RepID=UPI0013583268|nr:hypothetical protein [Chelativorans xinjiangense]
MTATRYSISRTVHRWASAYRRCRRRKLTERIMNDLPPSLQRDIGWQPTGPTRQR